MIPTGSGGAWSPTPANAAVTAGTSSGPSSPPTRSSWSPTVWTYKPRPRSCTTAPPLGLVDNARIRPREWVLVLAAGGGLGILLVQLVHAAGGRVIAAARGRRKLGIVRTLGADVVVDYSDPDWPYGVREATGGPGPDVVFDGAGGQLGRTVFEITACGGRFSADGGPSGGFTVIDPYEAERRRVTVRGIEQVQYSPTELHRMTERALSDAVVGRIKPVIGRTFPLEQAADAHAAIEAREIVGKTLLLTNGREPNAIAFTDVERAQLRAQPLGRAATNGSSGAPQVNPVAERVNDGAETIDIGGPTLRESQKFRNIQADPRISFVVDDIATPEESLGPGGQRGRGLESVAAC